MTKKKSIANYVSTSSSAKWLITAITHVTTLRNFHKFHIRSTPLLAVLSILTGRFVMVDLILNWAVSVGLLELKF